MFEVTRTEGSGTGPGMSRKGNNTGQQSKQKGTMLLHCSVPVEVSATLPSFQTSAHSLVFF